MYVMDNKYMLWDAKKYMTATAKPPPLPQRQLNSSLVLASKNAQMSDITINLNAGSLG